MTQRNRELLVAAARVLQPLAGELVFVGGSATGLMITDAAAADARSTYDVDVIAEIASYSEYHALGERLRSLGFQEDTSEGAPLCRWQHQRGIILDVMPTDERILGFSNRWYPDAMISSRWEALEPKLEIRVVTPPYFCATKLTAFRGRGRNDYEASHDLEDFITVVDGRVELVGEIDAAKSDVRSYMASEAGSLLRAPRFLDALPGYLLPDAASQARHDVLVSRLRAIAAL
jgi:predicted nucleotidyltransferase